jgi:predicted O-methyltransferase YrrM
MSRGVGEDADIARIRAARQRLAASGPVAERDPGDFERVALPVGDADILRDALIAERVRTVVEIGLGYGSSALAIAEALATQRDEGARHILIDAFQDQFLDAGWDALVRAGASVGALLIRERSQLALPRLETDGFIADAAFVDGSHIFHNVFLDLAFLREIVRPGGLVILDDCQWPSVATAVRYFELNAGWRREPIGEDRGRLRAFRLPDPPVEPGFEAFRPFGVE